MFLGTCMVVLYSYNRLNGHSKFSTYYIYAYIFLRHICDGGIFGRDILMEFIVLTSRRRIVFEANSSSPSKQIYELRGHVNVIIFS